jgi:hypothetical protein
MTYKRLPANTPALLRAAGLTVVEVDGWKTRGRPASTGGFNPKGVLCHHTATGPKTSNAAVVNLLVKGRSDLPGPLCQLGLARNGTVYVIASGRANHAGKAKSSGNMPAGDGNEEYIGIEAFNNGVGEKWAPIQLAAYVLLAATLSVKFTKNSATSVRGHKETSVTGKIDPTFNMVPFRTDVAGKIKQLMAPKPIETINGIKAPKPCPAKWNRFTHLPSNGYMNYYAAVIAASAVDIDVQKDKNGFLWGLHWNNVAKNGLHDPLKKIKGSAKISDLTTVEVKRLRSSGGRRAHSINALLELAWKHGTRIELEFKVGISAAKAKALIGRQSVLALHRSGKLQTKTLAAMAGCTLRLAPLQEAGFITILSFTDYKGAGIRKVAAWPVTDYTRGKPKWL